MNRTNEMITANVQITVENSYPSPLGTFGFFALPRVGELIHVIDHDQDRCLHVMSIDHWGYSETDKEIDLISILLTCVEVV